MKGTVYVQCYQSGTQRCMRTVPIDLTILYYNKDSRYSLLIFQPPFCSLHRKRTSKSDRMTLNSNEVGMIVASCAGAVIFVTLVVIVVTRDRNCFTFSRRHPPITTFDAGKVEVYGNLYVPPDRRPVVMAVDIVQHVLLSVGLPKHVKLTKPSRGQKENVETIPQILNLNLPRLTSLTPSDQAHQLMAQVAAIQNVQAYGNVLEDISVVGDDDDFEVVELRNEVPMVDPLVSYP